MVDRTVAAAYMVSDGWEVNEKVAYGGRDGPCTSGEGLLTSTALPDSNDGSLHGVLSTESADVSRMLCDFHLLDILSEGSTITGSVLSGDTDLSRSLGHLTVTVSLVSVA